MHPAHHGATGFLGHKYLLILIGRHACKPLPHPGLVRGVAEFSGQAHQRANVGLARLADHNRRSFTHGRHGNFLASGLRFSRWAEWNSFASSLM